MELFGTLQAASSWLRLRPIKFLPYATYSAAPDNHRVRPTICDGGGVEPREFNHLPALSTLVSNRPIGR